MVELRAVCFRGQWMCKRAGHDPGQMDAKRMAGIAEQGLANKTESDHGQPSRRSCQVHRNRRSQLQVEVVIAIPRRRMVRVHGDAGFSWASEECADSGHEVREQACDVV